MRRCEGSVSAQVCQCGRSCGVRTEVGSGSVEGIGVGSEEVGRVSSSPGVVAEVEALRRQQMSAEEGGRKCQ